MSRVSLSELSVVVVMIFLFFFVLLEEACKRVKLRLPKLSILFDPFGRVPHRFGFETAAAEATVACAFHETGSLEHPEMFGDRGTRDLEWASELTDRSFTLRETREDRPPRRVGERRKGHIESIAISNHMVTNIGRDLRLVKNRSQ